MQRWNDIAQKVQMGKIMIWTIRTAAIVLPRGAHRRIYGVDHVLAHVHVLLQLDRDTSLDHRRDQGQVQWEAKKEIREDVISRVVLVYRLIGLWPRPMMMMRN
jgi:hypothetical protein